MLHTTSSIREWRGCKRRFRYAYVDRVRPKRDDKKRSVGSLTHIGLEAFAAGLALQTILDKVDEHCQGEFWSTDAGQVERARVRAMLLGYFERWLPTRDDWETLEVETEFGIELRPGVTLGGKKDAVVRHKPTGVVYVKENKTTSEDVAVVGSDYWQRLGLDLQITLYQHDAALRLGEMPGILYDVLRKPDGKPRLKEAIRRRKDETDEQLEARKAAARETVAEFESRLLTDMLAEPETYFVRREVHRLKEQNDGILAELRETVDEIEGYRGSYPRNDGACQGRYGVCPYLAVCTGLETLDSDRFVHLETNHPELTTTDDEEAFADCPL